MTETNIGDALHRLLHAYKRALRQAYQEAKLPLTISHMRTLKVINRVRSNGLDDCTAQVIATRLQRDKAQVTRLIKELLAEDLIDKQAHPEDRRSQILSLTDKGSATVKTIKEIESLAGRRMADGLGVEEVKVFIKLANAMSENLEL